MAETSTPGFVTGREFAMKWAEAPGIDPNETRRVIIDADVSGVLVIYVEKIGTKRMLKIEPPDPGSVQITVDFDAIGYVEIAYGEDAINVEITGKAAVVGGECIIKIE